MLICSSEVKKWDDLKTLNCNSVYKTDVLSLDFFYKIQYEKKCLKFVENLIIIESRNFYQRNFLYFIAKGVDSDK